VLFDEITASAPDPGGGGGGGVETDAQGSKLHPSKTTAYKHISTK
jgi:hypothetical protein